MIQLYTGVPGAGKTYKMVADLHAELSSWETEGKDVLLVSNIKELKLVHEDFDDFLLECFPDPSLKITERVEKFFDYDYQASLHAVHGPIMYVIDECQLYFPRRSSLPKTEAYLQRHRHLGHYIYLATQSSKLINSNIVTLVEMEYNAARRTMSIFGEFRYRMKSPLSNEIISTVTVRPKKKIFQLYKSFESKELKKPKRVLLLKLWPLFFLPFAFYLFYFGAFKNAAVSKPDVPASISTIKKPPVSIPSSRSAVPSGPMDDVEQQLRSEVEQLKKRLNEKERVFLPIVKMGDQILTVDPDTNAVVDIRKMGKAIVCHNGYSSCYYDRPLNSGVRAADTGFNNSPGSLSFPSGVGGPFNFTSSPRATVPEAGPANFVDESLVPVD